MPYGLLDSDLQHMYDSLDCAQL